MLLPFHNVPPGATFNSHPAYMIGNEYYNSPQVHGPVHESTLPRPCQQSMPSDTAVSHQGPGQTPPMGPGRCETPSTLRSERETSGGRGVSSTEKGPEHARATPTATGRPRSHTAYSAPTSSEGGNLRDQVESLKEPTPLIHPNNSSILLSTNSSKSSPPYTLSQRKQLRVEEKSYLKEVKRSIAEGRVPQVRLQQNNFGDIVQYKAQFLNALKLAALALVPNADIDIKNSITMQEIMKEVKRQFIIDKPLPEGMVSGFLQRLYKRNRAVYHRHWILHGDLGKPDDCPSAAWLQLVDYWKSREGSKECERNKANASAKKVAAVCFPKPYLILHSHSSMTIKLLKVFKQVLSDSLNIECTEMQPYLSHSVPKYPCDSLVVEKHIVQVGPCTIDYTPIHHVFFRGRLLVLDF